MRRLVLSVLAAGSIALLAACSQGGSAFTGSSAQNADHVQITSAGNPAGILKVVPGGSIVLSAQALKGSNNVVLQDTNFTFDYAIAPAGTPYPNSQSGTQGFCNTLTGTATVLPSILTPGGALGQASGASVASPSGTVTLTAPASITAGFGSTAAFSPTTASTYCLTVNAHHVLDGVTGSATVLVTLSV